MGNLDKPDIAGHTPDINKIVRNRIRRQTGRTWTPPYKRGPVSGSGDRPDSFPSFMKEKETVTIPHKSGRARIWIYTAADSQSETFSSNRLDRA